MRLMGKLFWKKKMYLKFRLFTLNDFKFLNYPQRYGLWSNIIIANSIGNKMDDHRIK